MLERLDAIDWSRLNTCYGHSEEIPVALRNLLSDDAALRRVAFGTLHTELTHQGSIYEASVYVVPFLLDLLALPDMPDKLSLVELLANLGSKNAYLGESFQELAMRLLFKDMAQAGRGESPDLQKRRSEYRMAIEKTHQAVREGFPLLLSLFADGDPVMRMKVAYLFTFFPEDTSWLSPVVIAQLQEEQQECVIFCLLLCLGYLHSPAPEIADLLIHYLLEGKSALLRFVAAMALYLLLQEKTPEEAVRVLLRVLVDPYPLQPAYGALPSEWGSCLVHMRALFYLDRLTSSPHQALILERLLEAFPLLDEHVESGCADLLLRVAFYEKGFQYYDQVYSIPLAICTFQDLDPMQQHILQLLATKETLWQESSWMRMGGWHRLGPVRFDALAHLGLPSCLSELQAFISSAK
jgi:hypothetical protein